IHHLTHSFLSYATTTTAIYHRSLHDALPIFVLRNPAGAPLGLGVPLRTTPFSSLMTDIISPCFNYLGNRKQMKEAHLFPSQRGRSEEHTSELQSRENLVCRLLLEKNTTIRNA